jgi:citrate lyase subunit beta / citryl-CoA lyase
MRSWLYVPGNRPERFAKAAASGADALILDLEDAVPRAEKEQARAGVASWLGGAEASCLVTVRINRGNRADLEAVVRPGLGGVQLPKVESADEVRAVDERLATLEEASGIAPGSVRIFPLIESAIAVLRALEIGGAAARVGSLALGAVDLLADIGARGDEGAAYARSHLVYAARAANLPGPTDGVWTAIRDLDGLRSAAEHARTLGYAGKLVIHPTHVPIVNQVFSPTADEIAWARKVLGTDVGTVDGEFVDLAVRRRAEAILASAQPGDRARGISQ